MLKLALVGYGAMNKAIHAQALTKGFEVVSIISPRAKEATSKVITLEALSGADVAIECSVSGAVISNCKELLDCNIPVVVGTTGWYNERRILEVLCDEKQGTLIWSSNFSIGVNLFYKVVEYTSKLFNSFPNYDVWGRELHHRMKADAPSGTAKNLQSLLLENLDRKENIIENLPEGKLEASDLHFSSTRGGFANFEHTVAFDSLEDCLTLTHAARSRDGYALGALQVAKWASDKVGFYSMEAFIEDILQENV